jgi:hypothetical protein
MARTVPWHAPREAHYHNNTDCRAGRTVGATRREGSGGKRVCPECERRNPLLDATLRAEPIVFAQHSGTEGQQST